MMICFFILFYMYIYILYIYICAHIYISYRYIYIYRFPAFLGDFDVSKKKVFYLSQRGAVVIRRRGWQLQRQVSLDGTGPAVGQQNKGFKEFSEL